MLFNKDELEIKVSSLKDEITAMKSSLAVSKQTTCIFVNTILDCRRTVQTVSRDS